MRTYWNVCAMLGPARVLVAHASLIHSNFRAFNRKRNTTNHLSHLRSSSVPTSSAGSCNDHLDIAALKVPHGYGSHSNRDRKTDSSETRCC